MPKESPDLLKNPNRREFLKVLGNTLSDIALANLATNKVEAQNTPSALESAQREAIWSDLSRSAEEIVKTSADKDLTKVWEFLKEHGLLATPYAGGDYHASGKAKQPAISIIPLLKQDRVLPGWEKFANRGVSSYLTPARVMLFDSSVEFSPKFQGLAVLHESTHAFLSELHPPTPDNPDPDYMPNQERDVRERMKKVITKLGGPMYQKLLDDGVAYIKKEVANHPMLGGFFIPPIIPYNQAMDQIFGPAKSDTEKSLRTGDFYVQVWFEYLDKYYLKPDKEKVKTKILLTIAPSR